MDTGLAVSLLSLERLAPFEAIAGTKADAIALHNQSLRMNAAIMPMIAIVEIGLRNAISEQLGSYLGVPDWLTSPPKDRLVWHGNEKKSISKAEALAQRAAYAKLSNAEKKALDALAYPGGVPVDTKRARRVKMRQKKIQVGVGQRIAQLTLSFWKGLFSIDYEASLWKPVLRNLFPNKTISRVDVASHLEVIYEVRNRIAHHEAVIDGRLDRFLTSVDYITQRFGVKNTENESILKQMTASFHEDLDVQVAITKRLISQYSLAK